MFRDLVSRALYAFGEGAMYVGVGGFYLAAISAPVLNSQIPPRVERPIVEAAYEAFEIPQEFRIKYSVKINDLETALNR